MKNKKLHKIAPILSSLKSKTTGFKVPDDYFEEIDNSVIATLKMEALQFNLEESSFKTPEDYFNTVEDIVISKLKSEVLYKNETTEIPNDYFTTVEEIILAETKTNSKKTLFKNKVIQFIAPISVGIAASLLLIFTLKNTTENVNFDSIAVSEFENLIDNGIIDLDEISLTTTFNDTDLNFSDFSNSLTENEVLEYLSEKDVESFMYDN